MLAQDVAKAKANAELWLSDKFDEQTRLQVREILEQPELLLTHFLQPMEFGTAGLRGVMAPGISCMNLYTVAAATLGIAKWKKAGRVVIAYDARKNSREFAELAAAILHEFGFSVWLFSDVTPTPLVPFMLLQKAADLGLVITASHNPPKYNGLKVYAANGAQIVPPVDRLISDEIEKVSIEDAALLVHNFAGKKVSCQNADEYNDAYLEFLRHKVLQGTERDISLVYTPLHGAAGKIMLAAFGSAGFQDVHVVESQLRPDGVFPTVKAPNPEYPESLNAALLQAQMLKADLVLANDGDGDRIGIMVRERDGSYVTLNGNQIGCVLAYYLLLRRRQHGKITGKEVLISTVVSSPLLQKIAQRFNVGYHCTLTGFKWMGNLAAELETNSGKELLLAYEEAFGVAVGGARDKDGISAALLAAEAAAWCKKQNKTLTDLISEMYTECGLHLEGALEEYYEGAAGPANMAAVIEVLREHPPVSLAEEKITEILDFQKQIKIEAGTVIQAPGLPKQNLIVLKTNKSWLAVRPSGTEPKVKAYFGIALDAEEKNIDLDAAQTMLKKLQAAARGTLRAPATVNADPS